MHRIKSITDKHLYVAVSGGVDSMAILHHLKRKFDVTVLHFIHNDSDTAYQEFQFVYEYCVTNNIPAIYKFQKEERTPKQSQEEYWRNGRYDFFKNIKGTVVTGHTLDDAVEWYLFSAFNGLGKFMEYSHANVIRPYLTTKKEDIVHYAKRNNVIWLEDESNVDVSFAARNRIRHNILPEVLKVNPGIYKVVKKRILQKVNDAQF
jgi:tRNA(Ile)-lysidine synthetase-like protein